MEKEQAIDYRLAQEAIKYYSASGFRYLEVPWIVSKEAYNITAPEKGLRVNQDSLVASGEQSFLQLVLERKLFVGKYVCATPCYRPFDKDKSPYHFPQFFKVELIYLNSDIDEGLVIETTDICKSFFNIFLNDRDLDELKVVKTESLTYGEECPSYYCRDIEFKGLELGSYGLRYHHRIGWWVYGTGLALPRFQQIDR